MNRSRAATAQQVSFYRAVQSEVSFDRSVQAESEPGSGEKESRSRAATAEHVSFYRAVQSESKSEVESEPGAERK